MSGGPDQGGRAEAGVDDEAGGDALDQLATEQARADLADLDTREPADVVRLLVDEQRAAADAAADAVDALTAAVDLVAGRLAAGGRLIYLGAGTAGRMGVLDAVECPPTFGVSPERVVGLLAGGQQAVSRMAEAVEDDADAGAADVAGFDVGPDDAVVGVSASGRSPYAVGGLRAAADRGAGTVAVISVPHGPLAEAADVVVSIATGAEPVAGSTRMKAGTAQKIALNTISTAAMVGLGKTYGNLMVDVVATNAKLRRRAVRTVCHIAGVDESVAVRALADADGEAKTAVAALVRGVDPSRARALLADAGGRLRPVIERM